MQSLGTVVIAGAGISFGRTPLAGELKQKVIDALAHRAGLAPSADKAHVKKLHTRAIEEAGYGYLTLEVLFSLLRYRLGQRFDATKFWTTLTDKLEPSYGTTQLARLRSQGKIGPILTTNFDRLIDLSLKREPDPSWSDSLLITEKQLEKQLRTEPRREHVLALHGVAGHEAGAKFSPPISATARGLAKPFSVEMEEYLRGVLDAAEQVWVLGYAGMDHYDMNPLLRSIRDDRPKDSRDPFARWTWVNHNGSENEARLRQILGPEATIVDADTKVWLADHGASDIVDPTGDKADPSVVLDRMNLDEDLCLEVLRDLADGVAFQWSVLEHYRLFSIGYRTAEAVSFAQRPDSVPESPSQNTVFAKLRDAQHEYWKANANAKAKGIDVFDEVRETLVEVVSKLGEPDSSLRPIETALHYVALAVAVDYIGLIDLKYVNSGQAVGSIERDPAGRFEQSVKEAKRASETMNKCGLADLAEPIVQASTWQMIGNENLARALVGEAALEKFEKVIDARATTAGLIKQGSDWTVASDADADMLIAHLPQLWLRCSEGIKSALGITNVPADMPTPLAELETLQRDRCDSWFELCCFAHDEYQNKCRMLNPRYLARYEAEIIYVAADALSKINEDKKYKKQAAANILDLFVCCALTESELSNPPWFEQIRQRSYLYHRLLMQ